ncbi:MAG TPA: hypothetical protein PLT82_05730 [Candidatus Hydrogenedens sp.]|nr:hypothetical protein [Candidatus Hydrogenedens sp.]HOK09316.1 hypothetical protein [Candidatus Hydrogenedens sp.]HOL19823.1 hypothetical protein [Candidatus Hydrogenedens sp.]HPP58614.1 hypothetical protein [Candidatus Hydrogenedens sp.]
MSVTTCPFCNTDSQKLNTDSIKASLYLRAIFPGLSDLVNLDSKAKEIIANANQKILFSLRTGEKAFLKIKDGTVTYSPEKDESPTIHLLLLNPTHAVQVFEQGKIPIPLKGFTHISFLKKGFDALTKRLEYYLKSGQNYSEEERKIYAILQLKTALRAAEVLAEKDDISKKILAGTPAGILKISIESIGFSAYFGYIQGRWQFIDEISPQGVTSTLSLNDLETAELLLNNKLDTFAGLGLGKIHISGIIPIIDNVGLVLGRITEYIS